jgi:LmbE family N-acetylglucosaminyl deacetylase
MEFGSPNAVIFVPDGCEEKAALSRTTHMGVSAHQDDLEIMGIDGILKCFQKKDQWFTGVVVTDGSGSPRAGIYQDYTNAEMQAVRQLEQKKAALLGDYAAQILLNYPSSVVKNGANLDVIADLEQCFRAAHPDVVYTHNLADKHDTHVAVALRVITALRRLSQPERPKHVYGVEIWRDLDWMLDQDKVIFDVSAHENLQAALLGVFDSQISGGKRYDLATMGRRRANATYYTSHGVDVATGLVFAMDLTPLVFGEDQDIAAFVQRCIDRFARETRDRLASFEGSAEPTKR